MPPSALSSFSRSRCRLSSSFLVKPDSPWPRVQQLVELAQALDRVRDRLPVGQHAAEPAGVDVVLGRALGGVGDRCPDAWRLVPTNSTRPPRATVSRNLLQGLVQQRNRLRQVDDVDVVAGAVDVGRHLRVPAVGLVAEVNAGFEQLTHGEIRQSHSLFLSGWPPRTTTSGNDFPFATGGRLQISPGRKPKSVCGMARPIDAALSTKSKIDFDKCQASGSNQYRRCAKCRRGGLSWH
jgi:hypothetical protein